MADKDKLKSEVEKEDTVSYSGEEEKDTKHSKESVKPVEEEPKAEEVGAQSDEPKSGRNWTKIILVLSLIVNFILVGLLFFSQASKIGMFSGATLTPTPSSEIANSPTPTPEEVDLEAYEIEVQNGSGIAGEGARVKEILDKAGFKTGAVGNAQNSDYTDTIITVNDDVPDAYIEELTKVLEERGAVGKVEKFATGEDGEVLVIVGSDLSSATPTPEE